MSDARRNKRKRAAAEAEGKRLREESEKTYEGVKRASQTSFNLGGGRIKEGGLVLVPGKEAGGSKDLKGDVSFFWPGQPTMGLSFLPDYQLEGEMCLMVSVQEFTDATYLTPQGEVKTEPLCPDVHKLTISPTCGLLSLFNRVEVTYNNNYMDNLDNMVIGGSNMLVKVGALEASLGAGTGVGVPGFNRSESELGPTMSVWPTGDTQGYRLYRSQIPRFPFRRFSPWQQARVESMLGRSVNYPQGGLIPPETDLRVLLRRENRVPDIMLMYPLGGGGKLGQYVGQAQALTQTETRAWRRYQGTDAEGKPTYFEINSVQPLIRKLSLVIKLIHFCSDPFPFPPQVHTVYRSHSLELSKATSQAHLLNWDLPQPPVTLFLFFMRESEVMSGGSGIGDTPQKLNQLLSTSPDLSFRPLKLQELKLVDNTQPTWDRGIENLALEGMNRGYPDQSWRRYAEHLR